MDLFRLDYAVNGRVLCSMIVFRARRTTSSQAGHGLNYDEVVVYNEEAALPTYLIVYS